MNQAHFFRTFSVMSLFSMILLIFLGYFLYNQIHAIIFELNLAKNREQAERLATLISINLENGRASSTVLQEVQRMLENTPQSSEHFACIIADPGRVIAHPKPSNVNKDTTGWTIDNGIEQKTYTQSAGEGVAFGGVQTRVDGSQDITYQVPISTKPWSVCVHTDLDLIAEQATVIMERVSWIVAPGVLLITFFGAFYMSRRKTPKVSSADSLHLVS